MESIDISLILAQLINFLILFFLFKRYVAVYLNKMIEQRNATVEKVQNFEQYYDKRVAELQDMEKKMIDEAKEEAQDLLEQAESISQKKASEVIAQANNDVKMILEGGKRQVEKERFQMIEDSRQYILGLAMKINKKLLGTQSLSEELIAEELKKM